MPSFHHSKRGLTLTELTVIVCILFVLAAVLYPVFAKARGGSRRSGATNQKQIALGILQYIQDYDEHYPPAVGYLDLRERPISPTSPPEIVMQSWGPDRKLPDGRVVPGIISPYTKSNAIYIDPTEKRPDRDAFALHYMYNDLLTGVSVSMMPAPARTVLTTDAENRFGNAGHALTPDSGPYEAKFNAKGGCLPGEGASVRGARMRVAGGANFAFADGHVKWEKGGSEDRVFFPPRESASVSAIDPQTRRQIGPKPGKDMWYDGRQYAATFHIK